MQLLRMWRAPVDRARLGRFDDFLAAAAPAFRPLLRPALRAQAEVLGLEKIGVREDERFGRALDVTTRTEILDAELLVQANRLIAIYVQVPRQRTRLVINSARQVTTSEPGGPSLEVAYVAPELEFVEFEALSRAAEEMLGCTLRPYRFPSTRFDELKAEGRESPSVSQPADILSATILADRTTRSLATSIKTAGGLLLRDVARQLPEEVRERASEIQTRLQGAQLVESEIVVVCSKSQSQTARAPSRELIASLSDQGLRCACGRAIADERIEEALTITDHGRAMLDKSHWLTILLIEELTKVGVPLSDILVDQQLGGDEIDCLANISGELTLFELKDKEFNLGNAYSFGAKIAIIRPEHSVIISTERVGNDAKDHFQRARLAERSERLPEREQSEIRYIEGVEALSGAVRDLADQIYVADIRRILSTLVPLASLTANTILESIDRAAQARLDTPVSRLSTTSDAGAA